jgi:DNA-binding MarR family transcriptional regulator
MRSVKDEIQQTRPFASPADEGIVTLLRTADAVRRALSEVVSVHGITLQQYNVLRILRGAGKGGLPTLDVADRMIETTPGITRLLERLERKGLAARQRSSEDHRRVLCRATPEGLRILGALDRQVTEAAQRILGPLGSRRTRELVRLLDDARGEAFASTAAGRHGGDGASARSRRTKTSQARR